MLDRLIRTLVNTNNEAADDLLLEALRLGIEPEQQVALGALLERKTSRGLSNVINRYDSLPESLQERVLREIKVFHHAIAECGRSEETRLRLAAMRLIALGHQGKLAYVLSENLHDTDEQLSKAAVEALVALARWVSTETRRLQKSPIPASAQSMAQDQNPDDKTEAASDSSPDGGASTDSARPQEREQRLATYNELMVQRPEIEAAVARAINVHRGKHGQDLLRAALLLADWPASKTLAILQTTRHGGQTAMLRRLQQPPESEHADAFLLAASHGHLRSHFGVVFSHIDEPRTLDALLRRTYWIKDHQLQLCISQVTRGTWWGVAELVRDLDRRPITESARIAEWLAASGIHDVEQDERMQLMLERARRDAEPALQESFATRLCLLRIAMRRRRGASVQLIRTLLSDPDERIVRMAAREVVRRRPADFENILLKLMAGAPPSVRRVVGRSIGQAGFEQFWQRFDRLDRATRKQAGKAMLKLLPDAAQRLQRRAIAGPPEQRIKAMQVAQELGVADGLRTTLEQLCADPNPKIRSKAIAVLGEASGGSDAVLVERLLNDGDPRVRANTIEVLETRQDPQFLSVLTERALAGNSRERANAVKALCRMRVSNASSQLLSMLRDERPEHRISALWALRQIGWWQLLNEVAQIAKADANLRVRRYALAVIKTVAELVKEKKTG